METKLDQSIFNQPIEERGWNGIFKIGGISFVAAGILFFVTLSGLALFGSIPAGAIETQLEFIVSHGTYYSIAYGAELTAGFLFFPSLLAAYLALRHTSRTLATVAFGTMVVGIPVYIISAVEAMSLISLASQYAGAINDPIQSGAILGAGLAASSSTTLLSIATDFIFGIGSILNGVVFFKSRYFGKVLGSLVFSGGVLAVLGFVLMPALALAIVLFAVAFIITGWKLYAISRRSVPL